MKQVVLFLLAILFILIACSDKKDNLVSSPEFIPDPSDTTPPHVTVVMPGTVQKGMVAINVAASDNETEIRFVNFTINGSFVYRDEVPPYKYNWETSSLYSSSSHEICAEAIDNGNNKALDCVTVTIAN